LNHLAYADELDARAARYGNPDAALARYGADLLGRAIGHNAAAEGCDIVSLQDNLLIRTCIDGATRQIMAHMAARDILGA
jgi:hypothetical protein